MVLKGTRKLPTYSGYIKKPLTINPPRYSGVYIPKDAYERMIVQEIKSRKQYREMERIRPGITGMKFPTIKQTQDHVQKAYKTASPGKKLTSMVTAMRTPNPIGYTNQMVSKVYKRKPMQIQKRIQKRII